MKKKYKENSFGDRETSLISARTIVPIVMNYIKPKSVVDIGCNIGTFLSIFKENGVEDILGIDGYWINKEKLFIPQECFLQLDLEKPFSINRKFDLAVCLEVAEHLSKSIAENFIKSLTELSSVVLFAAAIPFQGGVGHINEQWPEYWAELFKKFDYVPIDCIRRKIWSLENINPWYAQNIFLFVRKDYLENNLEFRKKFDEIEFGILSMVHPRVYLKKARLVSLVKKIFFPAIWLFNKFKK